MIQRILEAAQQNMAEKNMSEEQIEKAMEITQKFMTPVWLFIFSILSTTFMGFLFSLIISIFTRKEESPFNTNIG